MGECRDVAPAFKIVRERSAVALNTGFRRRGSGNGSGRTRTASITAKIVVLAPRQSARVSTATAVKPGFFSNWRKANFKSFINQFVKSESVKFELAVPLADSLT